MAAISPARSTDATIRSSELSRLSLMKQLIGGNLLMKESIPGITCIQRDPEAPELFPFGRCKRGGVRMVSTK